MFGRIGKNLVQLNEDQLAVILSSMLTEGLTTEIVLHAERRASVQHMTFNKIKGCDWQMRLALCELVDMVALTMKLIDSNHDKDSHLLAVEITSINYTKLAFDAMLVQNVDSGPTFECLKTIGDILLDPHVPQNHLKLMQLPWSCRLLEAEALREASTKKERRLADVPMPTTQRRTFLGDLVPHFESLCLEGEPDQPCKSDVVLMRKK